MNKSEEEFEDSEFPKHNKVTYYGADFTVYSLVNRLERDEIYVPAFQRRFVWTQNQASLFIESLLLGLPTPNIFLARDNDGKMFIIDGQQRLLTLLYFFKGKFGPAGRTFTLRGVSEQFANKTYEELAITDRRHLDDSIIHTTIIEDFDYGNIFEIFERLNTTGTPLVPQEMRSALFDGEFNQLLHDLNQNHLWREIFGDVSDRLKDEELLLRFFALFFYGEYYRPSMNTFLNHFMQENRNLKLFSREKISIIFEETIEVIYKAIGKKAFRISHSINSAVFDAIMVGLAKRLQKGEIHDINGFKEKYKSILRDKQFLEFVGKKSNNYQSVYGRLHIAASSFEELQ